MYVFSHVKSANENIRNNRHFLIILDKMSRLSYEF